MQRLGSLLSTLLLCALPVFPRGLGADTWTSFRGPDGNGSVVSELPPGSGPLGFEVRWKHPLGSGYSGISISGETLVTATAGDALDYVVALDIETGTERWRYDLAPAHKGHDGSHDGPISTPAIADGRVFALSPAGQVAAIDLDSGQSLWRVHLVEDLGCEKPFYDFGSSPLVVEGTVVLQIGSGPDGGGAVAGFDAATGKLLWRSFDDRIETQSPIWAEIAGRHQILVLGTSKVAGLDPIDGTIIWQWQHDEGPGISLFSSPLPVARDLVFLQVGRESNPILRIEDQGSRLEPVVVATSPGMSKSYSPPTFAGGTLFGYTARFLSAVDTTTGDLLWRSRQPGDGFLVALGDRLVVLTKKGTLHLGSASTQGWQESYRVDLFEDLAWTPPSVADGSVFVRSLGEIARVDMVRAPELVAEVDDLELPAALRDLAAAVSGGQDPRAAVDRFLEDRRLPIVRGRDVVFVWRGEAQDVAIAGDMIGMRREEPMRRLEGTDLWWWETEMDPRMPAKYLFYVDYEPTVDPSNDRVTRSTILGPDMNWSRGEGVTMSWFAMPQWPGWRLVDDKGQEAVGEPGRVDLFELTLEPSSEEDEATSPDPVSASIPVWLPPDYDSSDQRYPVVYVSNATAREFGDWPAALDRVAAHGSPLIVVFLELDREVDRPDVLIEQILPAVDRHYRTMDDPRNRAIVGMGWPGFGAAMTAFENPEAFGILGVQSFFALDEHKAMVQEAIGEKDASSHPMRIYLEWGRWDLISAFEEMDFRASSLEAWNLLQGKGWDLIGGEVWDSTDWSSWRNRTDVLLEALFPIDDDGPELSGWLTSP